MKIVIDTNLFVAGYFNKESVSRRILEMIERGGLQMLWNEAIKAELERILKNIKAKEKYKRKIAKLFKEENRIQSQFKIKEIKEDPEDNKFLEAAYFGKAEAIISSDQHLLKLGQFKNIPILTPKNFLEKIKKGD